MLSPKPRPTCRRCMEPINPEPRRAPFAVRVDGKMVYLHNECAMKVLRDVIKEDNEKRQAMQPEVNFKHGGYIS